MKKQGKRPISEESAIPQEPEFTSTVPNLSVRYTDEELKEFKDLILLKLEEAKTDYSLLKGSLSRTDDNGTDDTFPGFRPLEDAGDVFSKEEIAQLAIRQQKFIENLQNALVRIENKTYGICRISGKLIAKERLKSVPHTTMSIDAKIEMSKYT